MRHAIPLALAALTLAMAGVAGLFYRENRQMHARLEAVHAEAEALRAQVAAPSRPAAPKPAAPPAAAPAAPALPPPSDTDGAPTAADIVQLMMRHASKAAGAAAAAEGEAPGLAERGMGLLGGMMGDESFAAEAVGMAIDMQYGGFFAEAGLAPELEQAVRAVLSEAAAAAMHSVGGALQSGDLEALGEVGAAQLDAYEGVRAQLAGLLDPQQLAAFEQYTAGIPERMLGQTYEMQMSMMAPGLSAESREAVRDAIVGAMLDGQPATPEAGYAGGPGAPLDAAAVESILGRLEGALDPQQLEIARGFLERQASLAGTFR